MQANLSRWQTFVRGIAAQQKAGRVLLKSPNHTFRLASCDGAFRARSSSGSAGAVAS
jgi:hypothetical protein